MKKSNKKGFTLVELVVVIAIIGVLAAILVPSMMGYVKKSRLKTANSNAKTAYNSVATFVADQETKGTPVTFSSLTKHKIDCVNGKASAGDGEKKETVEDKLAKVVKNALSDNGNNAGEAYVGGHEINGNKNAFFVQWHKGADDATIGQYPNPVDEEMLDSMTKSDFGKFYDGTAFSKS